MLLDSRVDGVCWTAAGSNRFAGNAPHSMRAITNNNLSQTSQQCLIFGWTPAFGNKIFQRLLPQRLYSSDNDCSSNLRFIKVSEVIAAYENMTFFTTIKN